MPTPEPTCAKPRVSDENYWPKKCGDDSVKAGVQDGESCPNLVATQGCTVTKVNECCQWACRSEIAAEIAFEGVPANTDTTARNCNHADVKAGTHDASKCPNMKCDPNGATRCCPVKCGGSNRRGRAEQTVSFFGAVVAAVLDTVDIDPMRITEGAVELEPVADGAIGNVADLGSGSGSGAETKLAIARVQFTISIPAPQPSHVSGKIEGGTAAAISALLTAAVQNATLKVKYGSKFFAPSPELSKITLVVPPGTPAPVLRSVSVASNSPLSAGVIAAIVIACVLVAIGLGIVAWRVAPSPEVKGSSTSAWALDLDQHPLAGAAAGGPTTESNDAGYMTVSGVAVTSVANPLYDDVAAAAAVAAASEPEYGDVAEYVEPEADAAEYVAVGQVGPQVEPEADAAEYVAVGQVEPQVEPEADAVEYVVLGETGSKPTEGMYDTVDGGEEPTAPHEKFEGFDGGGLGGIML